MSARFTTGDEPPKHATRMKESEIERAITTERQFHTLAYRKGSRTAFCNCGYMLREVTPRDVHTRHGMHVNEAMRVFEARIKGEET